MWYTMNEGYRAWGAMKSVLSNRGLGIKAKKRLYERVIIINKRTRTVFKNILNRTFRVHDSSSAIKIHL